jgi:DNA-binding NarL/FixJ family response regulator
MSRITVLLADDHLIVREGLRALLVQEPDLDVVGEAGNGRQAVELCHLLNPDVVVMDIAMPQLNGLEAARQILRHAPATRVLILSAHSDDAYVEHAMELGAAGYLIKQTAARNLSRAIRMVHGGEPCFSPAISRRYQLRAGRLPGPAGTPPTPLSAREMEVLQLIAEGKPNKETAALLHISIKTVEKHRQKLMQKLNIHDTASLTRYAIAAGVIESSTQSTLLPG